MLLPPTPSTELAQPCSQSIQSQSMSRWQIVATTRRSAVAGVLVPRHSSPALICARSGDGNGKSGMPVFLPTGGTLLMVVGNGWVWEVGFTVVGLGGGLVCRALERERSQVKAAGDRSQCSAP